MSSRYPPQRGRSPPRFPDRRTSVPHGGFQGRNTDSSYRPGDDGPREPPRGPKSFNDGSRGGPFTPRGGRGGFSRGRGGYDSYNRRDSERSWSERREPYDDRERPRSPVGRGRSRSPTYRDSRDPPDSARAFDSPSDRVRGGFGSRGRGSFERGGRGRPFGSQDRDRFRARSRSRDRFADDPRDDRFDRDNFRRDEDRWDRGREGGRRDGPLRPESRVYDDHARTTSPSAASTASGPYNRPAGADSNGNPRAMSDTARRSSFPASARPDIRAKEEPRQQPASVHPPSSPPQAPSVPAYGSDTAFLADAPRRPSVTSINAKATSENAKTSATPPGGPPNAPTGPRAEVNADPLKDAPRGPKADLAKGPIQPQVRRSMSNTMPPGRPFDGQEPRSSIPGGSPQIPSGPRALTSRQSAPEAGFVQGSSSNLPNAPRGIPTGPKVMGLPTVPSSNVWVRPGARQPPTGPTNGETSKRDSFGEEKPKPSEELQATGSPSRAESAVKAEENAEESEALPELLHEHAMDVDQKEYEEKPVSDPAEQVPESDFALPQSDDDDAVSDDGMSEEDLRAQEAKFEREKEQLESKRPPLDSEDNELLVMLDELDALAVALDDWNNGTWPPPKREELEQPEPSAKLHDIPPLQSKGSYGLATPPSGQPSEELEDLSDEDDSALPYKRTSPPTPMSQLSVLKQEFSLHSSYREQMLQRLALRTKSEQSDAQSLRKEFAQYFYPWRAEIDDFDKQRQAEDEANAAVDANTDMQDAPNPATPAVESTRGGRRAFTTQLELDQALALSKQTHAEEQARAKEVERDMLTVPDMTKECIIPDMLNSRMQERSQYKDSNNSVEHERALELFNFVPPEDDFTEEEQDLFKKAYEKNARKQWGHIAKDIPGRTYKDCIMHYYLTKRQDKYKRLLQKKSTGRRGRQGKGKTNALLSDLAARADGDGNGKVEVTDTGRPKRAAAPTNFDRKNQQEVETTPQRGRGRGKSSVKAIDGAEGVLEKPTRGRGGARERGGRRGRGAAGPAATPGRRLAATDGTTEAPAEEPPRPTSTMMEEARLLADFQSSTNAPMMVSSGHTENWLNPPPVGYPPQITQQRVQATIPREELDKQAPISMQEQQVFSMRGERTVQPPVQPRPEPDPPQPQTEPLPAATPSKRGGSTATGRNNQSSSYWSVMEQNQVSKWASILGSNWDEYAARMKAKSAVMVRNHVSRLTADGKNPHITDDINRADEENKHDAGRIESMTAAGKIEAPLGNETTASLQRPIVQNRKTSGEVKQEREEEKKPARPRAESHIAVAPKPASQSASLEASPAGRPRVKSNASTKSSIISIQQQQQQQQQQQALPQQQAQPPKQQPVPSLAGPQMGYFDVPSKPKEKPPPPAHTSEPRHDPRVAPVTAPLAGSDARPSSAKWTIGAFIPRENTISASYTTTNTGVHPPRTGVPEEPPRQIPGQQPQYGLQPTHQSPYSRAEERLPHGGVPLRHDSDPARPPQAQLSHAPEERSSRVPLHVEAPGPAYQRQHENPLKAQQPVYTFGREPSRNTVGPPQSMSSLLREEQPRPGSAIAAPNHPGPGGPSIFHGHGTSVPPTPVPQPASAPAPAPAPPPPKRSNIMDILNSGDPEPPPKRITTDSRAPAPVPTPPPSQTPVPPPPYQPLGQSQYSSRPPVQQQFSQYTESPFARRDTPPDRPGVQQHPSQHPGPPYEPQRQSHPPHHLQQHYTHSHGQISHPHEPSRHWPQQQPPPQSQHSYPPQEQPRYGGYSSHTSHASPQPTRPSFAPPPPSHPQYASSTSAGQYRAASPAHRGPPSMSNTPRVEHGTLPPSVGVHSSRPGPPFGVAGHAGSLMSRPPSGFGSPLSQEHLRIADERQRREQPQDPRDLRDARDSRDPRDPRDPRQPGFAQGMYAGQPPPREYAGTPQHGYRGPPPQHYQQQQQQQQQPPPR